jgi:cytochrome c oxidase assembly protein subunit 15
MKNYYKISLRRLSKLTSFSTLFLIFVGALVKSHEVGLSVPDWPTTYGKQMFAFPLSEMVGGIFYEHGHRMLATIIGFFTLIQAIVLGFSNEPYWLKKLGYIALGTVISQGIFGGITVLFYLPPAVSIIHGILAQTFFVMTIIIAYSLSVERKKRKNIIDNTNIRKGTLILVSFVYIQLILGALMRHTASGMAIPDFPTMGGLWFPTFSDSMIHNINVILFDMDWGTVSRAQVIIHFLHRLGAIIVTGFIGYLFYKNNKIINTNSILKKSMWLILFIVIVQFTLGALTVITERAPYIASFHVVNGAALLGACILFVLRIHPIKYSEWFK